MRRYFSGNHYAKHRSIKNSWNCNDISDPSVQLKQSMPPCFLDLSIYDNYPKAFAIRIIKLYQYLTSEKQEYTLSKQALRSGTSIGANVRESLRAQSKADFIAKQNIALKEADETCYWLELLHETDFITDNEFESMYAEANELVKLLVSIIKTAKANK